jgi:light-harvesting complex I chlorophyll a/b binding protein 1/light-harvesting complex I chlorophyll a/b binding protein 4
VGNFGDPLNLSSILFEGKSLNSKEGRLKELNNGRMAMIAVALIFGVEWITGEPSTQQLWFPLGAVKPQQVHTSGSAAFVGSSVGRRSLTTARGFFGSNATPAPVPKFKAEEQFGASEPLGFFDPMGFSIYGDEAYFRRLREAELKHGRVAMLASVGFWAEHLFRMPGFAGEQEGVLSAFDSLSNPEHPDTLPFIFMLCGWLELGLFKQDPKKEVGNFGDPLNLSSILFEGKSLNSEEGRLKELNNGRMAMVALAVIFGTEWVTGVPSTQQLWFPF